MPSAPGTGTGIRSPPVSGRFLWHSQGSSLCLQGRGRGQRLPRGWGGPGGQHETGEGSVELEQGEEIVEGRARV